MFTEQQIYGFIGMREYPPPKFSIGVLNFILLVVSLYNLIVVIENQVLRILSEQGI